MCINDFIGVFSPFLFHVTQISILLWSGSWGLLHRILTNEKKNLSSRNQHIPVA